MTASCCCSGIRSTLPVEAIRDSASARCASSQCEPGEMAAMPSSTSAGVLGMTRTTATPSGTRDSMKAVVMPAARRDQQLAGAQLGGDLVEQGRHVLRLDHEHDGVGLGGRLGVGHHVDAVVLLELAGPLGPVLADQQVVDATSGAEQARRAGSRPSRRRRGSRSASHPACCGVSSWRSASAGRRPGCCGLLGHPPHQVAVPLASPYGT